MGQNVAVFGATSAVASALAHRFARTGARLALVGRSGQKLSALRAALPAAQIALTREGDFDITGDAAAHVTAVFDALGRVDVVVIAHGLLGDQRASEHDVEEAERIARTNYLSVVALLIAIGNRLEAQRHGTVAVLSSVAADRGRPRNYTYAAAKAALNVYLEGLQSRLFSAGVRVVTVKLGPVDSPMTATHAKNALFSTPEVVARQIERAISRNARVVYVPRRWWWIMAVVRHLPEWLFQRMAALSGR